MSETVPTERVDAAAVDSTTQATFPLKRCPFGGQAEYERMREQGTISKVPTVDGGATWWATNRGDVKAILVDPRFSSNRHDPKFPLLLRDPAVREQTRRQPPLMITMDGTEHAQARRAVIGEFTVKRPRAVHRLREVGTGGACARTRRSVRASADRRGHVA